MKRRNVVLAATSVFVILAALIIVIVWHESEPSLTVHLRCEEEVSGALTITTATGKSKQDYVQHVDVDQACAVGEIKIHPYVSYESVSFSVKRDGTSVKPLTAISGRDIQRDEDGFYTVLKIMNAHPFLANDRI